MNAAIENLTTHQQQLDPDGCRVGVSRQALDETLALVKEMRAMLADCYMALHDHYHEAQASYDMPPEPADEWSSGIIPMFVAIQRVTGKNHDELMLKV
jgi:hypothetical protein